MTRHDRYDVVVSGTSHLQINQSEEMCQPVFQVQKVMTTGMLPCSNKIFGFVFFQPKTRNTNLNLIIFKYAEEEEKKENVFEKKESM